MEFSHDIAGPDLVFVHGFGTNSGTWDFVSEAIRADHRCHFINLFGYGSEVPPDNFTYKIEQWADQLTRYIDKTVISDRYVLVCHSLGCAITLSALRAGTIDPDYVVLVDPLIYSQGTPSYLKAIRLPLIGPLLLKFVPKSIQLNQSFKQLYHNPARVATAIKRMYSDLLDEPQFRRSIVKTIVSLREIRSQYTEDRYKSITSKLYLIYGEMDRVINSNSLVKMQKELPFKEVFRISDCGHAPQEECPIEFNRILTTILEGESKADADS